MRFRIEVTRRVRPRSWQWVAMVVGLCIGWSVAIAEEPASAQSTAADPLAECLDTTRSGRKRAIEDEFCLMRLEHIGKLSIGIGANDAVAALPCPVSKGKETFSEDAGDYAQTWSFPACGVTLTMASSNKGGPKVVTSIVVAAPSTLATSKDIHIGSSEEDVLAAYGPFLDRGASRRGKTIVAGSIYGGLIISIADGTVSEIFLGAIAE